MIKLVSFDLDDCLFDSQDYLGELGLRDLML